MRILVTGSRDWTDIELIREKLDSFRGGLEIFGELTLVHGDCPRGADRIADTEGRKLGYIVEAHPADWQAHGKRAGFLRNAHMVELGADACLAFIKNGSKGASMCANLAEKAGIPTFRFTEETL